jgi:hypothetical protein
MEYAIGIVLVSISIPRFREVLERSFVLGGLEAPKYLYIVAREQTDRERSRNLNHGRIRHMGARSVSLIRPLIRSWFVGVNPLFNEVEDSS